MYMGVLLFFSFLTFFPEFVSFLNWWFGSNIHRNWADRNQLARIPVESLDIYRTNLYDFTFADLLFLSLSSPRCSYHAIQTTALGLWRKSGLALYLLYSCAHCVAAGVHKDTGGFVPESGVMDWLVGWVGGGGGEHK